MGKRSEADRLEAESAEEGFWNDNQRAQAHLKKLKTLQRLVDPWEALERDVGDAIEIGGMLAAEPDPAMEADLEQQVGTLTKTMSTLEFQSMLSDPDAACDAYLFIHAGAGGTESCDWANMLLRMYTRWAERRGFDVKLVDLQPGDEAGITRANLLVRGEFAFGFLNEIGRAHV